MKTIITLAAISGALALTACGPMPVSADEAAARQTEQLAQQAQTQVGVARVRNFFEKRLANQIIEARDNPNLSTFAYVQGLDGRLICLGEAIGYGLPYSAQTTNPEKFPSSLETNSTGNITIPQAEPNGLFMPESAAATWVMLIDEKGVAAPVYIEGDVTVSPFKLRGPAVAANCAG